MDLESLDLLQTQRIVFLVDLHPLQNPSSSSYIASIIAATRTILSFPPLSTSLFAFKLFFSSLSPLLSTSKLHRLLGKSSAFFSFDRPSKTLISLTNALNSLSSLLPLSDVSDGVPSPRASLTAESLRQLVHDYAWEPQIQDSKGTCLDALTFRSNLIIIFSPHPRSLNCLSEFMNVNVEIDDDGLGSVDVFSEKIFRVFGAVSEGFASRDIHFTWVDVNFDRECVEENVGGADRDLGILERGIKGLGWGFCSTNAIVLGSAIVPFGLIFPNIGCLMGSKISDRCEMGSAELSLVISDVNGQPLECKCCDLELLDLKLSGGRSADISRILECVDLRMKDCDQGKVFWRDGSNGITKICVKDVWRSNKEGVKIEGRVCDFVLLRGFSGECKGDQKREASSDFFADKVLEMLRMEITEFTAGKPAWQLLLSFLHRESYCALVSVSAGDVNSAMGILRPFTVHSAILCIIDSKHDLDSISSVLGKVVNKKDDNVSEANDDFNCSNVFTSSQSSSSSYSLASGAVEGKRKRSKKHFNLLQDLTWSSFCKTVFSRSSEGIADDIGPEMDLAALYFSKQCNNSKKLRFVKCWMKQIKNCSGCQMKLNEPKSHNDVEEETDRIISSQQESEVPICSSILDGDTSFNGSINDENPAVPCLETLEAFSESICQKIQQSLNSEEVDLGLLAERVLHSSIHWLSVKLEKNAAENPIFERTKAIHPATIATEVEKLLLRKPRDLAAKYKGCDPSSLKPDLSSSIYTSEQKVREHELQILFRMEILHSKVGAGIEEPARQKMIKEICSLLESIEFNLQGGLFGGESLVEFAGRTIKTRYACSLVDVIRRIYTQMEFLSFGDDDEEASGSLPNSDANGEQRAKEEKEIGRKAGGGTVSNSSDMNSISAEDERSQPRTDSMTSIQKVGDIVHERKLMVAQERRERARRFASFTSWVPDLQRVWAPKQLKVAKSKSESQRKPLGRRERRGGPKEVVCETPMVGLKRTYEQGNAGEGKHANQGTNKSYGSVSKALFRRDEDARASSSIT